MSNSAHPKLPLGLYSLSIFYLKWWQQHAWVHHLAAGKLHSSRFIPPALCYHIANQPLSALIHLLNTSQICSLSWQPIPSRRYRSSPRRISARGFQCILLHPVSSSSNTSGVPHQKGPCLRYDLSFTPYYLQDTVQTLHLAIWRNTAQYFRSGKAETNSPQECWHP